MVKINCASRCANVGCPRNMDNENYDKTRPLAYLEKSCKNFKKFLTISISISIIRAWKEVREYKIRERTKVVTSPTAKK